MGRGGGDRELLLGGRFLLRGETSTSFVVSSSVSSEPIGKSFNNKSKSKGGTTQFRPSAVGYILIAGKGGGNAGTTTGGTG